MSRLDVAGLVDIGRLTSWMDDHGLGTGERIEVSRITTGHSNELFSVRRGRTLLALRRPPATPLSPTAHDMAREFQVLAAVVSAGRPVPVPNPMALCADPEVIGAPFFLMQMVDGVVARHAIPDDLDGPGAGREVAEALIDALGGIHSIDWMVAGLDGFGRPQGYLDRQVGRWSSQLEAYQVRPLPVLGEVGAWLQANRPPDGEPRLIHGDYTLVNVLLAPQPPIRLAAVVDWEMSTIGDPLVDLGWLLGLWTEKGETRLEGSEPGVTGFPDRDDMPTRSELADRYASATGADLSHLPWYCALALFKLACVMEGSYARHVEGTSDDPHFAHLEQSIPQMAERAAAFTS